MAKKKEKADLKKDNEKEILNKKEQNPKLLKKKQNRIVFLTIILMISLFLIIIFLPGIISNWFYSFNYHRLDFEKTKQGSVNYFSTNIPLTDQKYNQIGNYALNLRNDPRKLNLIPSYIPNNTISFIKDRTTYISVNSDGPKCDNDIIAAATLAYFLNGFGGINVAGALDNEAYANASREPYVTCNNTPMNTVIMLKPGNETYINKTSENCYIISYNKCEMLQASEKFQLTIVESYMDYLNKTK